MKDPCSRNRIALLAVVAIMLHIFAAVSGRGYEDHSAQAAPAAAAATIDQPTTRAVQLVLKSFGYTIAVDGVYGPQTTKVVKSWQKSNGLTVDGVAGPETQASLGLSPAVRVNNAQPIGGLNGLPFAPANLNNCDEMRFYREQAGLPETFDALGWRESNCRNEDSVRTFCCYGYWQNYISSHLSRQSAYRQRIIDQCQVRGADDINSDDPLEKQKQACVTAVVYSISGYSPWGT